MRLSTRSIPFSLTLLLAIGACAGDKPADTGSTDAAREGVTAGECSDAADNDADGAFDCDDNDCAGSTDCVGDTGADTQDSGVEDTATVNAAPSGVAIAIEPAFPTERDDLDCIVTAPAVDPDGDTVSNRFAWTMDATATGLTSDTVPASLTEAGQVWACTVTPTDGLQDGTSATTSVAIAQSQRAPSTPGIAIAPSDPTSDDTLMCTITTPSIDPDGDAVTYAYGWTLDGASTGLTSATVDAALTSPDQTWTCAVTASDGTLTSGTATASVTLLAACAADDHDCDGIPTATELAADCTATFSIGATAYYLCDAATWAAGEAACVDAGVHLAALTTATESSAVTAWLDSVSADPFVWVGFNDLTTEGVFTWTSGEAFTYTNWHAGEPDNRDYPGNCGNLAIPEGDWWDGICSQPLRYVCEAP